ERIEVHDAHAERTVSVEAEGLPGEECVAPIFEDVAEFPAKLQVMVAFDPREVIVQAPGSRASLLAVAVVQHSAADGRDAGNRKIRTGAKFVDSAQLIELADSVTEKRYVGAVDAEPEIVQERGGQGRGKGGRECMRLGVESIRTQPRSEIRVRGIGIA